MGSEHTKMAQVKTLNAWAKFRTDLEPKEECVNYFLNTNKLNVNEEISLDKVTGLESFACQKGHGCKHKEQDDCSMFRFNVCLGLRSFGTRQITPLYIALLKGWTKHSAEALVDMGAYINHHIKSRKGGESEKAIPMLFDFILMGNVDAVEFLLKNGANYYATAHNGILGYRLSVISMISLIKDTKVMKDMFKVFLDHVGNESEDGVLFSHAKSIYNFDQWKSMNYTRRLSKLKALDAVIYSGNLGQHFQEKVMNTDRVFKILGALHREMRALPHGDLATIPEIYRKAVSADAAAGSKDGKRRLIERLLSNQNRK